MGTDANRSTVSLSSSSEPDLGNRCVLFEKYGHCNYGFNCRFGESHIDRLNLTLQSRLKRMEASCSMM